MKQLIQIILFILMIQSRKSQDSSTISTEPPFESTTSASTSNETDSPFEEDLTLQNVTRYCACDLTGNLCDLNCCCDPDCSAESKHLFSKCVDSSSRYRLLDSRYCYNQKIIFRNNTNYILERMTNFGGLFCIYTDNTKQQAYLVDKKIIKELSGHKELNLRQEYNWTLNSSVNFDLSVPELIDKANLANSYHVERPIYSLSLKRSEQAPNKKFIGLAKLRFPYSLVVRNGECNSLKNVGYLSEFSSYCFKWIRDLQAICKASSAFDVNSYTRFLVVNGGQLSDEDSSSLFIENVTSFCGQYRCVKISFEGPVKATVYQDQTCQNMVKSVDYQIIYDERIGIKKVVVAFEYADLKENDVPIRQFQRFTVRFEHESLLESSANISHYSGNLGYQLERPLIARAEPSSQEAVPFEFVHLQQGDDMCDPKNLKKQPTPFGLNHRSGCFFDLDKHLDLSRKSDQICTSLNEIIFRLFDEKDGTNSTLSAYGKYNLSSENWVPLLRQKHEEASKLASNENLSGKTTCALLKQVNYLFVYAMVADLREPQRKLVSAIQTQVYHSFEICLNSIYCRNQPIELSTSIQFLQMKSEKRMRFADSPAFKLKLPEDFFYPISN